MTLMPQASVPERVFQSCSLFYECFPFHLLHASPGFIEILIITLPKLFLNSPSWLGPPAMLFFQSSRLPFFVPSQFHCILFKTRAQRWPQCSRCDNATALYGGATHFSGLLPLLFLTISSILFLSMSTVTFSWNCLLKLLTPLSLNADGEFGAHHSVSKAGMLSVSYLNLHLPTRRIS